MKANKNIEDILPLSPLQGGILFHALYTQRTAVYFEQFVCRLAGRLDRAAFAGTWQALVERHAALRTAFVTKGERGPVQVVFRSLPFETREMDWRGLEGSEQSRRLAEYLEGDRAEGFVFNRPPLMRVALIRLGEDVWQFVWSHHHILLDGWSLTLLVREFFDIYAALADGARPRLPPRAPFGDYVKWLGRQDRSRAEKFWREYLAGFVEPTQVGVVGPRAAGAGDVRQEHHHAEFSPAETARLEAFARAQRLTLSTLFQAAWALLLGRYGGGEDIVFGVTLSGRSAPLQGVEQMVGLFINSLPLRVRVRGGERLRDWLREIQERNVDLQQFEYCDLTDVQRWAQVPRGRPLFESLLAFENYPAEAPAGAAGLRVESAELIESTHFPLVAVVVPGERLKLKVSYDAGRVAPASARQLAEHLRRLLAQMADGADLPLSSFTLSDAPAPATREGEAPAHGTLGESFRASAAEHASRVAVADGGERLTYERLAEEAGRLAGLLARLGVGPEARVGICMERSARQIAAMLAVVQAGGAYVPLDPAYPSERLAYMVEDSACRLVLTTAELRPRLEGLGCATLCVEECETDEEEAPPPSPSLSPDNAAYVIYTSGSTGRPKGVVVTHRNVLRLFASCDEHFEFKGEDVWSYFHSFSFDFSVWEIWGALLHGARVVVVPYLLSRDPAAFYRLLSEEGVTVLSQTPSAFRQLTAHEQTLREAAPLSLRYVVFGGEALEPQTLRPWFERHGPDRPRLVNMYGITETTVHVTFRPVAPEDTAAGPTSLIGRPLPDLEIHLLDEYGHPAPDGVRGEICVGGAGLARGYLNQPGATASKFTPHPFAAGARLYRSGDLARRLPDGDLEYLGRADSQVKVRGFRIETAEVAAALLRHENIREATARVYAGREGEARLAAYAVCRNGGRPGVEELRDFLRRHLPDHMLPDAFVFCEAFPLTLNGKLDVDALPDPELAREVLSERYVEPAEGVERELADIWRRVLGVERVGRNDNFFALGGDSIRSISVASSAKDKGIVFSIQQLFEHQTVARLAAALNGAGKAVGGGDEEEAAGVAPFALVDPADRPRLPEDLEDAYPLARLQAGMLFHSDYGDGARTYQDAFSFRLRLDFDEGRWRAALEKVLAAHPVLRTSFHFAGLREPLQFVHRSAAAPLTVSDLRGLSEAEQEAFIDEWLGRQLKEGFDWGRPPLFRMSVHRLRDDVIELSCVVHHAILDGWSAATFFKELAECYLGASGRVAAPAASFREFVALERDALASEGQREFWRAALADPPEGRILRWPAREDERGAGERRGFAHRPLGAGLSEKILAFARSAGLPVKSVLLAAHLRVLQLLTGGEEVLTGLVSNGRPGGDDGTRVLGLFLNTIPLRLRLPPGSWLDLCRAALGAETALLDYRRFPLAEITRLNGNAAPFETSFNFVNFHVYEGLAAGGGVELLGTKSFEQVDIPFSVNFGLGVTDARLSLGLMYDRGQFPDAQAEAIADHYERALAALVADPSAPHADADLLGEEERRRLLIEFNDTARTPAAPPFVHECVGRRAAETPSADAVVFEGRRWSYAELEGRAARLARLLRAKGVGPDTPVALLAERSFEMVCALLAVLKAGSAYVPLDPEAPEERTGAVLQDSRAPLLLTQESLLGRVPRSFGREVVVFERCEQEAAALRADAPDVRLHPSNLAYVLFTSGSTGRPKGVAVTHEALANHMRWMQEAFPLGADDAVLQKTPYGFDASVWEFWAPLMAGARLVLARPGGQQDPAYLIKEIQERRVTILQLVPTMLEVLLGEEGFGRCDTLRRLFVGGEALKTPVARRARRLLGVPVVNLYGPTETTIQTSAGLFDEDEPQATANIGSPIHNARYYVLDESLRPVPVGAAGELYVGGLCLARGYFNRPALTAEKFVPDLLSGEPGARLYRTGDLVRHLPGGRLEYLGRTDRQLKLRGFRVELADVEAALATLPGVVRCAAALRQTPDTAPRLVAFYQTATGAALTPDDIKRHLRARLPAYMVPTAFQRVERWPLLASGKTDFAALPTPEPVREPAGGALREASTETERVLAEVWQKVLRVGRVGADEDFFALGGDSILSLQIVAEARRRGLDFTPQELFKNPTVAALALAAKRAETPPAAPSLPVGEVPLTPIQRFFFGQNLPNVHHWNQAVLLEVAPRFGAEQVRRALGAVVSRHDAFRLRFRREGEGWRQFYADELNADDLNGDEAAGFAFDVVDLRDVPDPLKGQRYEAACNAAQSSLNIEDGPLVRSVFFRLERDAAARLVVVCHHLVVDGVSWRILLEDLQAELERPGEAPGASLPFGAWARRLAELSPSEFEAEADFWARQEEPAQAPLPTDFDCAAGANTHGSASVVERALTAEETRALLVAAPRHLRATAAEVLLASLAEAVADWTGSRHLSVSLEGHGREPLFAGVDLSRTVGWFTSLYPLRVESAPEADAPARLAAVKRQARRVPRGGVGYGLLGRADGARPQVSLNYLGQFDNSFRDGGALRIAEGSAGDPVDPAAPRTHLLDVVALVAGGRLTLRLNYSRAAHRAETIERLAESLSESLKRYARAAERPEPSSWVAEDFQLARLEDAELSELLAGGEVFEDVWPLSPVQEGMLFHTLEEGAGSGVYVQQLTGELRGGLDPEAMRRAWEDVLGRHPNLRASFAWAGPRRPLQKIRGDAGVPFKLLDWRAHDADERRRMLERFLAEDRAEGFDLRRGPLMRFALVRLGEDAWQLVWTHHHILLDGWSLPLILSQFVEAYGARREGRAPESKAAAPYARYLSWLQEQDAAEAEEFWRGYLAGFVEPTLLAPAAEGAGPTREPAGPGRVELTVDEQLSERLRDFARRRRLTVNNVVQAAWGFVLCRHARTREVVYGVTVSGRPPALAGSEEMVGLFINTLPLRVEVSPGRSIDEWLSSLQSAQSGLLRFQHNRLIDIAGWSEVPRGRPLFDTILVFENYPVEDALRAGAGDFKAEALTTLEQNNYPLTLYVTPGRELRLACAFDAGAAARLDPGDLLKHLARVVRGIVEHEGGRLSDLELTSEEERRLVTEEWNATAAEYESELLVPARFARAAALDPRKTALTFGAERMSYGELEETSNRLARFLQELGARPETRVGLLLERTPRMVCALLAVLKSGAAYVPLDPAFPKARLRQIVEEAAPEIIVTESGLSDSLPEARARRVLLDREWADIKGRPASAVPSEARPQNLAYLIFTSGSTGRPKGVQIPHRALTNALESFRRRPGLSERDVFAAVTTISFDIAALELFLPLLAGATLALVPREAASDGIELSRLLAEVGATAMQATPVTWRMLLAAGWTPPPGFAAWCGGEALPHDLASALLERGVALWNLYGPTETTIWSTVHGVRAGQPSVLIGTPINNTQVYVLDDAGNPLPPGVAGELYVGGEGLARGYLNLAAMTAERLVPDPFSGRPGARLYRTGDLAAFGDGGALEYFGRADLQTKVDGFRIELGDVEAALRALPGVRQAAAAVERDARGANRLAGYLVYEPSRRPHAPAELREMLLEALPAYMVPASFALLEELPLTPNNKLDRKALAAAARPPEPRRLVAPRDAVEEALLEIWKEAFQRDDIGADEDFFELGGHSLLATQIHVKVVKVFRVEVPLRGLFRSRTVGRLAALVKGAEAEAGRTEKVARAYLNVRRMSPEERRRRLQSREAGL